MKKLLLSTIFVIFAFAVQSQSLIQTKVETYVVGNTIYQKEINVTLEEFLIGKVVEELCVDGWPGWGVCTDENGYIWVFLERKSCIFARIIGSKPILIR